MKKNMSAPRNVDAYIKSFPAPTQKLLKEIRSLIQSAAPKAEESISYGMVGYKLNGPLVYFGGFAKHIGFYATPSGNAAFVKETAKYKTSKGAVQFPLDEKIPAALVKKMVVFRVKENKAKALLKAKKTTP